MALGGFLYQLKKASQSQLFHSVTDTVDYSLAMPGNCFPEETIYQEVSRKQPRPLSPAMCLKI